MATLEAQIRADNVQTAQEILATDRPPVAVAEVDEIQPPVLPVQDAPPRPPPPPIENFHLPEDMP